MFGGYPRRIRVSAKCLEVPPVYWEGTRGMFVSHHDMLDWALAACLWATLRCLEGTHSVLAKARLRDTRSVLGKYPLVFTSTHSLFGGCCSRPEEYLGVPAACLCSTAVLRRDRRVIMDTRALVR